MSAPTRRKKSTRSATATQVDGYGNAVSPQVGTWLGARLRAVLHSESAA